MSRIALYVDVDGCASVPAKQGEQVVKLKEDEAPVFNPHIMEVVKSFPDAEKYFFSSYWAFQGTRSSGGMMPFIANGNARLRFMSEAEQQGVDFKGLIATGSVFDDDFGAYGDSLLAHERDHSLKVLDPSFPKDFHNHSRVASLYAIPDSEAFIQEDICRNDSISNTLQLGKPTLDSRNDLTTGPLFVALQGIVDEFNKFNWTKELEWQ